MRRRLQYPPSNLEYIAIVDSHARNRSVNICGASPLRCTPSYELRVSQGAVVQFVGGPPPPCNASAQVGSDSD